MEPDGEIAFTPDNALPDIRVLALTLTVDDDGNEVADIHMDDFYEHEALGLLRYAVVRLEAQIAYEALADLDEDED